VKIDPLDVAVADITAPSESGVVTLLVTPNPKPPGTLVQCAGPPDGSTCAVVLQHSCDLTGRNGDPAVRIRQVVHAARHGQSTSVCETSYQGALQGLGDLIGSLTASSCIDAPLPDPAQPDCAVTDVTPLGSQPIPPCATAQGQRPCWTLAPQSLDLCPARCARDGDPGQHFAISVERNQPVASNVVTQASCHVLEPPTGTQPTCGPAL
jgi:hypothetical protein